MILAVSYERGTHAGSSPVCPWAGGRGSSSSFFTLVTGPRRSLSLKLRFITCLPLGWRPRLLQMYSMSSFRCCSCENHRPQFENKYFTEMRSGSEAGSYLRLVDFVYHSTLGLRVMKKKKGSVKHHREKLTRCEMLTSVASNQPPSNYYECAVQLL